MKITIHFQVFISCQNTFSLKLFTVKKKYLLHSHTYFAKEFFWEVFARFKLNGSCPQTFWYGNSGSVAEFWVKRETTWQIYKIIPTSFCIDRTIWFQSEKLACVWGIGIVFFILFKIFFRKGISGIGFKISIKSYQCSFSLSVLWTWKVFIKFHICIAL